MYSDARGALVLASYPVVPERLRGAFCETIAEYHETGILRILQPRRFGGMQGRFSLFSRLVEELTYCCAAAAWVYAVLAEHQWIIAQYPEQAQIDVWGDDPEAVEHPPWRRARRPDGCQAGGGSAGTTRSRVAATMRNGRSSALSSARRATRGGSPTCW